MLEYCSQGPENIQTKNFPISTEKNTYKIRRTGTAFRVDFRVHCIYPQKEILSGKLTSGMKSGWDGMLEEWPHDQFPNMVKNKS